MISTSQNLVVLDASAIIAFLADEPGGSLVRRLLGKIVVSSIGKTDVHVLELFCLKREEM